MRYFRLHSLPQACILTVPVAHSLSANSDIVDILEYAMDDAVLATQPWVPTAAFMCVCPSHSPSMHLTLSPLRSPLCRFTEHECTERNQYSLSHLPSCLGWGIGVYGSYLCVPRATENVPNIWVVGHLASLMYVSSETETRPRIRIQLDLLRALDRARASDILNMSSPPTGMSLPPSLAAVS